MTRATRVFVQDNASVHPYEAMTLAQLGLGLAVGDDTRRWRFVAEFLEEYRWEPSEVRPHLLSEEPAATGDGRWDVFLAALAEHLAAKDGRAAPTWAEERSLRTFWFRAWAIHFLTVRRSRMRSGDLAIGLLVAV